MGRKSGKRGASSSLTQNKTTSAYYRHLAAARQASQIRKHREAADKYLAALLAAPNVWMEERNGKVERLQTLTAYTSFLLVRYFTPAKSDFAALINFVYNEKEPISFRVHVYYVLGVLEHFKGEREESANYFRDGLQLSERLTPAEGSRKTTLEVWGPLEEGRESNKLGTLEAFVQNSIFYIRSNLEMMENGTSNLTSGTVTRPDGSTFELPTRYTFTNNVSEEIQRRLTVGGAECDTCHKSLKELQRTSLDFCGRCQMAYYCSVKCQKTAWNNGHKLACRKKGEIKPDDIMRLQELKSKPNLNGMLCKVLALQTNGRWNVQLMDGRETRVAVKPENLDRLRPAA